MLHGAWQALLITGSIDAPLIPAAYRELLVQVIKLLSGKGKNGEEKERRRREERGWVEDEEGWKRRGEERGCERRRKGMSEK